MSLVDASGVVVVGSFLAVGIVAWRVRPRNRVGPLMIAVAIAYLLGELSRFEYRAVLLDAVEDLWLGVLAHLALAFPTGRLRSVWHRSLIALVYVYVVLTDLRNAGLLGPSSGLSMLDIPPGLSKGLRLGLSSAMLVALIARWRSATPAQRRLVAPVLGGFVVFTGLFVLHTKGERVFGGVVLDHAIRWTLPLIPVAYLFVLLRRRLDRAGVAGLVVRLGDARQVHRLTEELAAALHDPGVRLAFWSTARGHYVDADGDPVGPHGAGRAVTRIDRGGRRIALLEHDVALVEEPELVEATCAAAALALENARLAADLRARVRELAASRTRLVHASDQGRRRLERDLHDGVQQRLLAAAMLLARAEQAPDPTLLTEAKATVLASLAELRALCQGIHPPVLAERGLPGALRELADTAPIRVVLAVDAELAGTLPPEVESAAYYVAAEAVANAVKHAETDQVEVTVHRTGSGLVVRVGDTGRGGADPTAGSGLAGLVDRVEAVGGRLVVSSVAGLGTTITAELPCAS